MFGKILKIDDNIITIENISKKIETGVIGYHVVFQETNRQIVGEIQNVNTNDITIYLIGEIKNDTYISGVIKKPSFNTSCRIITKRELEYLLGRQDYTGKTSTLMGNSIVYDGFKITASTNDFFSNHFAVLGNSGSGKSCGVARLLQNIFYYNDEGMPVNSHFVIFDVFGEYNSALEDINKLPNMGFKNYTTDTSTISNNSICIPAYFLGVDDLALLLNVDDPTLIPVIENTLRLTYIFTSKSPKTDEYKDFIIASNLMDILSSGKTSNQMRDQLVAVLTKYNTPNINLESAINQPGYNRTLKQCLNIDAQGKMNAISLVIDFLKEFSVFDLNSLDIVPNFIYTLDDLAYALEFSLINEGILNSNSQYEKLNTLKVRLNSIINSPYKKFFEFSETPNKHDYVIKFFQKPDGTPAQVVNMNFNYIDERMAKNLTKIYAKLFYDFVTSNTNRATYPIHMILEEAHRYVQNDNDVEIIGYNIFDRITKEGRKYGILLGLISQRPSELSTTSLSQCSNFVIFRMYYPDDLQLISSMTANLNPNTMNKVKTLRPGMALCFGSAFKVSSIVELELPKPMPMSTSVDISKIWY